jgi:hypothetical protein
LRGLRGFGAIHRESSSKTLLNAPSHHQTHSDAEAETKSITTATAAVR